MDYLKEQAIVYRTEFSPEYHTNAAMIVRQTTVVQLANEQVAKLVQYYGDFEKLASQAKGEFLVAQTEMDVYRTLVESIVGKRANIGETLSAFLKVYRVLRAAADQVGSEAFKEYPVSNTPQPKE